MKKTGELLKQKRESANLSISEVALATKINPKILTAIEKGEDANLPAMTFLKGFIKSYALYLKMDADVVLRQFLEETVGGPAAPVVHEAYRQPDPAAGPTPRRRPPDEGSSGLRTVAVFVIAILIALILGVRELIEKYQKEKVVNSAEVKVSPLLTPPVQPQPSAPSVDVPPAPDASSVGTAPVAAVVKAGEPPATPAVSVPPVVEAPAAPAEPEKPAAMAPPLPAPPVSAKAAEPTKVPVSATPAPTSATETSTEVAKATGPLKTAKNEIILEALDKVDVQISVHGESKKLSLAPSQVHTIRSDGPLVLDLSDGGAVNIILNGRERGVPGDLGKPKQVKIP